MATTMYFEETLRDVGNRSEPLHLEFGRSSAHGESLMYLVIDEHTLVLDREVGKRIAEAMSLLAGYLSYG